MRFYVFFKGSVKPDATFPALNPAREFMEGNRYTGVIVTAYPPRATDESVEMIWYDKGVRR